MPLVVFADLDTASPKLYYVHPDHLNRPLRMTDGTQAVVRDAVYKPFGEAHSIIGSATLNLRFPGQYFLIESGLAYNWHRHYDPSLGRYTQPDPMGFSGWAEPVCVCAVEPGNVCGSNRRAAQSRNDSTVYRGVPNSVAGTHRTKSDPTPTSRSAAHY
jgi:RHS repeat-associated protein